jgi:hypothetical protein
MLWIVESESISKLAEGKLWIMYSFLYSRDKFLLQSHRKALLLAAFCPATGNAESEDVIGFLS